MIVLGDLMLDYYTYGKVERINPEAPVPILRTVKEKYTLGGAGNVAKNIAKLNENVLLMGIIGNDNRGEQLKKLCNENNIKYQFITDGRPTIVKHRFVALGYNQQLLRVDYEETDDISSKEENNIINFIDKLNNTNIGDNTNNTSNNIMIISDYNKGLLTKNLINNIKKTFNGKILVDPKPENIEYYKDVYLIKPNLKEASQIYGKNIENNNKSVEKAGLELVEKYNSNFVITRSEKGATLITTDKNVVHIPTSVKEIHDVSGAGDTFIAVIGYCLNNNYNLEDSVKLANKASSIVVGKVGTAAITYEELFKGQYE